jgi:putative phosphoesterase
MKIGIVSDIHGDFDALETVLNRLDQHHQVDQILCAGDLVGRGPDPDRVVSLIRQRGIPTVRGNHDEWFYGLSSENSAYLKALPVDWVGTYAGRRVFMCHGKPGNNMWGLYRDHISDTLLNMMLVSLSADVLISGHTHVPFYARVARGCVVNPGSVYVVDTMRASSHTYGVLRLPDLAFELYDVTTQPVQPIAW